MAKTFAEAVQGFGKSLTRVADMIATIRIDPEVMKRFHQSIEHLEIVHWWRWRDESLLRWGDRLQRHGLMDDPEIRAAYQCAVWEAVVSPVGWLRRKLTEKKRTAYEWNTRSFSNEDEHYMTLESGTYEVVITVPAEEV